MSWRESYQPASFRGVPFYVASHSAAGGRRAVTHEFPGRDVPYTEDLGRQARTWTVEAYVIGDDYHTARDRLIEALEAAGPGELVHPYLGSLSAVCIGLTVGESVREMRMATMSLRFAESGQPVYPASTEDPVRAVSGASSAVQSAVAGGFASAFTVDGVGSWVSDAAALAVGGLSSALGALPVLPVGDAQSVAAWAASVTSLQADALSLITTPATLAGRVLGVLRGIAGVYGARAPAAYRSLRTSYAPTVPLASGTPAAIQADANNRMLATLVRQTAITEHAALVVAQAETGAGFATRDEAVAVRDELADAVDTEQERPETDAATFAALGAARAAIVRNIPSAALSLPRVVSYTPRSTLPSVVVAYQLYGDAGRAVEIAERNRLTYPGFVPGGRALQVLADA